MRASRTSIFAVLAIMTGIALFSCKTYKHATPSISNAPTLATLPGYVIRDSGFTRRDFNAWVITTELSFDSIMRPVYANPERPNFDTNLVVAMKAQTTNNTYKVNYKRMELREADLNVYFSVVKEHAGDEEKGWVSVSTYPKNKDLRRVNFFFDDVLIRTIPVVIVY